jgi:hypothetical protein
MALDLTGINNHSEYYSHHYLLALLEGDLKEVVGRWDQVSSEHPDAEAHRPPPARLRSLIPAYFRLLNRLGRQHDAAARAEEQGRWLMEFLTVLGYEPKRDWRTADKDDLRLPLLAEIRRASGAPLLWVLPALPPADDLSLDPLTLPVDPAQYAADPNRDNPQVCGKRPDPTATWDDLITRQVFGQEEPPRWVLLISVAQLCLIDRTKWSERRYLSFDFQEIFNRRDEGALRAVAALLHRESICPANGFALLDTLDENSHRHAFAVSESLKHTMRECVEQLANEAIYYRREVSKKAIFNTPDQDLAVELSRGCLRYLYRLLFVLYLEARPELGYLPIKSDEYLKGYSFEFLRDLELIDLHTDKDRDGLFFDTSIRILFRLIFEGRVPGGQAELGVEGKSIRDDFRIAPLKSHLFDPGHTPIIEGVKFRNHILQDVVRKLSLGRQGGGKNSRSGRISYAQLGINQLGAVYENLLSYTGFFAKTDLYEVKPADDDYDPLVHAFFVTEAELANYSDRERVYEPARPGEPRRLLKHPKGMCLYRLAGRNRKKSASYYTPESLTQCVVKYALKELLPGKTADEILNLTVCEMAVGSAAFLNEAVNQLADAYLQLKQKETGKTLAHDEYAREKQRVKMRLADNNVFGVDLNPTAVELAEISLWLNTIFEGAHVPWFGLQLANGNSLVGARRQVFPVSQLGPASGRGGGNKARWTEAVPKPVAWTAVPAKPGTVPALPPRPVNTVYHWLVPDPGMSVYSDKVVKELKKNEIAAINAWRKGFCLAFDPGDQKTLLALSTAADELWQRHLNECIRMRQMTSDPLPVWPETAATPRNPTQDTHWKDEQWAKIIRHPFSPYRRLKLAMDYWCALWFWPIAKAELLPSRDEFIMELSVLLGVVPTVSDALKQGEFTNILVEVGGAAIAVQPELNPNDKTSLVNVETLCRKLPRLALVADIAKQRRFFHWELEYVDVFAKNGGFDLIAGNPPWVKIEWNEGDLLSEHNPAFAIRKLSASDIAKLRSGELDKPDALAEYLSEYEEFEGTQNFLNALQNYPLLKGQQTNLYKCFITRAWELNSRQGVTGFLHPEGVYDDPNGGPLRRALYPRLRFHFGFENHLLLFAEVHHNTQFSVNVYHAPKGDTAFDHVANIFTVSTIDASYEHPGTGPLTDRKSHV